MSPDASRRTPPTRPLSKVAPDWWDYMTLEPEILQEAARLTPEAMLDLSREGFKVVMYDTLEDFYLAEALEYIAAWRQAKPDEPVGICGPIGPTEQLPLVARLVNELGLSLKHAHFWGMDEWFLDGREVPVDHPLSFARADLEMCFNRIRPELAMPRENLHFPQADPAEYVRSWEGVRCAVMQGGQGDVKHWAFNDPPRREGQYINQPPPPEEYLRLSTRVVELHPLTILQNARTSAGGLLDLVPTHAVSVGPLQTWRAEKVSIWQAGQHDSPFGMRLTTWMISQRLADASVPMSLLALHPMLQDSCFALHSLEGPYGTDLFVLDRLFDCGDDLDKLPSNILAASVPEAAATSPDYAPTSLGNCVEEAVFLLYSRYVATVLEARRTSFQIVRNVHDGKDNLSLYRKMFHSAVKLSADALNTILALAEGRHERLGDVMLSDLEPVERPWGFPGPYRFVTMLRDKALNPAGKIVLLSLIVDGETQNIREGPEFRQPRRILFWLRAAGGGLWEVQLPDRYPFGLSGKRRGGVDVPQQRRSRFHGHLQQRQSVAFCGNSESPGMRRAFRD